MLQRYDSVILEKIKNLYPDYYLKIQHLPSASIKGIVNNLVSSRIDIKNVDQMKRFFFNQPVLKEFIETEFKQK